jgi:hypothetical protein
MQTATTTSDSTHDPRHHIRQMSAEFSEIIDHLRHDADTVDEPQFRAMFETAAEVLGGLVTAFRHYEQKNEAAWNRQARDS